MTRPKLLCADDEPALRELYRVLLGSYGYDVLTADDGQDALQLFRKRKVDAVILDHEMPGLTGVEVAAEIKRQNSELPVLIVSGCQSIVDAPPPGVDAALAKGVPTAQLLETVRGLLDRVRRRRPLSVPRQFAALGSALATVAIAAALISRGWE